MGDRKRDRNLANEEERTSFGDHERERSLCFLRLFRGAFPLCRRRECEREREGSGSCPRSSVDLLDRFSLSLDLLPVFVSLSLLSLLDADIELELEEVSDFDIVHATCLNDQTFTHTPRGTSMQVLST